MSKQIIFLISLPNLIELTKWAREYTTCINFTLHGFRTTIVSKITPLPFSFTVKNLSQQQDLARNS